MYLQGLDESIISKTFKAIIITIQKFFTNEFQGGFIGKQTSIRSLICFCFKWLS